MSDQETQDGDDGGETVTDSMVNDAGVRTTVPDSDETLDDRRYESPDGDDEADDVDPRALFDKPSLNELRYYAREGPFGATVVQKPVKDAYKHGFDIKNTNGPTIQRFLEEDYVAYHKECRIKARRDGLCVLLFQFGDEAASASEPLSSGEFRGFQVFTVDNLSDEITETEAAEHTDYKEENLYVTEGPEHGGIVIVDDISNPDHGDIVGYGIVSRNRDSTSGTLDATFVHASRCQHFVHGEYTDGNLGSDVTGHEVGESVLTPILQPLKGAQMGYWALKNILYRYSAPIHAVESPESWGPDDWQEAEDKMGNLSMASDAVLPPGAELNVAEGDTEFNPKDTFDVLMEGVCAGTVFTQSVLIGSHSGTLSGSETDVKGYFNGVQRLRQDDFVVDMREAVKKVSRFDQSTVPRAANVDGFEVEWGPLFKATDIEQAEGMVSIVTAVTNGIKNYVLTPEEARSILEEQWAAFDADVDLDDLTEADWDSLDRINMNEAGQGASDNEPDVRQNPRQQNGGGQPQGQTRSQSNPASGQSSNADEAVTEADLENLSDEELYQELQRRVADDE